MNERMKSQVFQMSLHKVHEVAELFKKQIWHTLT